MTPNETTLLSFDDLLKIPASHLPLIVLSDNIRSFLACAIKAYEKGNYNHSTTMHRPGQVASQDFVFKERPIQDYQYAHRLELWTNIYWSNKDRRSIKAAIKNDLARPLVCRGYDVVGVCLGQVLRLEWIQIPWLRFCSESSAHYIGLRDSKVPKQPSPPDLRRWLNSEEQYQRGYRIYGRYIGD